MSRISSSNMQRKSSEEFGFDDSIFEEIGFSRSSFQQDHKILIRGKPPTLSSYPVLSSRVIVNSNNDEYNNNRNEQLNPTRTNGENPTVSRVFHESVGKIIEYSDRRPVGRNNKSKGVRENSFGRTSVDLEEEDEINSFSWEGYSYDESEDGENSIKQGRFKMIEKKKYKKIQKIIKSVMIIQKYARIYLARLKLKALRKRREKRKNLVVELLETEKQYVKNLKVAIEVYVKPLKSLVVKKGSGFRLSDFHAIFTSSYTNITGLNEIFCKDLEQCIFKDEKYQDFAKVSNEMLRICPYFKMYGSYCKNLRNALSTLKKLKSSDSEFAKIMKKMDMDERTNKLGLTSYLSLPVQRIPRYRMLLQGIRKNTEKEHPDYKGIQRSINEICDIADFLDSAVDKVENGKGMNLDEDFLPTTKFEISHPNRFLSAKFHVDLGLKNRIDDCYVHVFNDILVISKQKGSKLKYLIHMFLKEVYLEHCEVLPLSVKISDGIKTYVVNCINEKEMNSLMATISRNSIKIKKS